MNETNLKKLKAELADPAYAGMDDAAAADALNTVDRTVLDHTRRSFRDLLRVEGMAVAGAIAGKLKAAASGDVGVALAVSACEDYGDNGGLDFAHPNTIAGIDALVSGGVLAAADGDKLKALGVMTVSRADELGLGRIYPGHVQTARAI